MDLAAARDVKLIDQSDSIAGMKKINAGYNLITIEKGSYPKQDKDVKVIGYATHVVVSCKLPADEVYKMTRAIAEHTKDLATVAKPIAKLDPKGMAEDIGVPFHPGAARFYKEHGITVKTD
jgi:TRAP transporter TAXI family solute receptor